MHMPKSFHISMPKCVFRIGVCCVHVCCVYMCVFCVGACYVHVCVCMCVFQVHLYFKL